MRVTEDSTAQILALNPSGFTQVIEAGTRIEDAFPAVMQIPSADSEQSKVLHVDSMFPVYHLSEA